MSKPFELGLGTISFWPVLLVINLAITQDPGGTSQVSSPSRFIFSLRLMTAAVSRMTLSGDLRKSQHGDFLVVERQAIGAFGRVAGREGQDLRQLRRTVDGDFAVIEALHGIARLNPTAAGIPTARSDNSQMQAQAVGLLDGMVDGFERFGSEEGRACRNRFFGNRTDDTDVPDFQRRTCPWPSSPRVRR